MTGEKHILLTIGGSYTGDVSTETWQCGIRFLLTWGTIGTTPLIGDLPTDWNPVAATINRDETDWTIVGNWSVDGPLTSTFSADDWLNDQVAPAIYDWIPEIKASNALTVETLKVYPIIGPSGKADPAAPYATGSPVVLTWKTPLGAGTTTGLLPLQNSIVASHRTTQIGRRGRGRVFLPPTGPASVSFGRLASGVANAIASGHADFLATVSLDGGATDPLLRPIVTGAPWNRYAVVTTVEVDDVMDTQRRRRRSLVPNKESVSVGY